MTTPFDSSRDPMLEALLAEASWVLELAKQLARDQAAAEDLAQSTMAVALERRPSVEGGLRPWLARVANRLARQSVRGDLRRRDREALAAAVPSADSSDALERFELQQQLAKRVAALDEPYRSVLIRRYYEGLSVKEIANATGASPATVRSQLARGLSRLRAQVAQDHGGRGALGVFLVAAGAKTGAVPFRTAQIAWMQTSTKLLAATAAALTVAGTLLWTQSASEGEAKSAEPLSTSRAEPVQVRSEGPDRRREDADDGGRPSAGPELAQATAGGQPSAASEESVVNATLVFARVVDEHRVPLEAARLSSIHTDGRLRGADSVAEANFAGSVALELADEDLRASGTQLYDMLFAVEAPGRATEFVVARPVLHGETDLGEVKLEPGATFTGQVVDSAGRAIAGATLFAGDGVLGDDLERLRLVGPEGGGARPSARSGLDGSFVLTGVRATTPQGRPASARLWAHGPGSLWTISEPLAADPERSVNAGRLVLEQVPERLRIEGRVVDAEGRAAHGVHVDYFSTGAPHHGSVLTDERGEFLVVVRDEDPVDLIARGSAEPFGLGTNQTARGGERVELQLGIARSITVTVQDEEGVPLAHADLMPVLAGDPDLAGGDSRLVPGVDWSTTDASGTLELAIPGGSFQISVRRWGSGSQTVGPFEGDRAPRTLAITLPRGGEVSGQVLAEGEPVPDAAVTVMRRLETFVAMTGGFPHRYASGTHVYRTDAEGRFRVPLKLSASSLGVTARAPGWATGEVTFDVESGESVRGIEIHLTRGGAIEGAVEPPVGSDPREFFVAASRGDGNPISTQVDERGNYRLEGLTPGEWRVEGRRQAAQTEMRSISSHPEDLDPRPNARVTEGRTLKFDLDLRGLVDVEVSGRLLIDGVAPPAGWVAEAVRPQHELGLEPSPVVELDGEGRFRFPAKPGRVDLRLAGTLEGGATVELFHEVRLEAPSLEWEPRLETGALDEWLPDEPGQARVVRGLPDQGDRELTLVPVGIDGRLSARVPIGSQTLQVPARDPDSRTGWEDVRTVLVR